MSKTSSVVDWPSPTSDEVASPAFETIWGAIKDWDIGVPKAYDGYCEATGSHVMVILNAIKKCASKVLQEK